MLRIEKTRMFAFRAASRTCVIWGTHLFASATPFKRSHTFPPSDMKSLYGAMTRSAVISLPNFGFAMFFLLFSGVRCRRHSRLFCRRGECRCILPDELLHAQRPLPR